MIIRGNPPGSLFSFITSVIMLYEPLKRVARLHVDLSSSLFGVGMLYDFLDAGDFEEDPRHAADLTVTEGRIEFRDVIFGYRPEERVLHSVSFVAEAGKTMALVGRSGGGKSTVMNLILRLYEIESGQILCDGVDIATVTMRSLRQQIGYVSQENFLFKGSVRDNIALGRPGASDEEIVAAAKAAYAHDFITGFERGYDTPCGEHGMQLSGGQRQRIAIARAFLKDAPIILLDEATSALELPNRKPRSRRRCTRSAKAARPLSSPTACPPWPRPTKSASWIAAGSWSAAATANCWRRGAPIATSPRPSSRATRPEARQSLRPLPLLDQTQREERPALAARQMRSAFEVFQGLGRLILILCEEQFFAVVKLTFY